MFLYKHPKQDILGMTNLNPLKTGLPVIIWADHGGVALNRHHNEPRVKVGTKDSQVSVSIEDNPRILAKSHNIKKSDMDKIQQGIQYVRRNYDLFLKHFMDTDFSFDDEDLFNALRKRGQYK